MSARVTAEIQLKNDFLPVKAYFILRPDRKCSKKKDVWLMEFRVDIDSELNQVGDQL